MAVEGLNRERLSWPDLPDCLPFEPAHTMMREATHHTLKQPQARGQLTTRELTL